MEGVSEGKEGNGEKEKRERGIELREGMEGVN